MREASRGVRSRAAACVHEVFEEHAASSAEAPAVIYGSRQLTYGQLNTRANFVANELIKLGVKEDVIVGIYLERSPEMLAAILGVLKAGGAFLPLAANDPFERTAYFLGDAAPSVVVSQPHLTQGFPGQGLNLFFITSVEQDSDELPNPGLPVSPHSLAYVIYTSGTTGRPKGVLVEHGGLRNVLETQLQVFAVTRRSRVLQFSPLTFDASIFDFLMAWGGCATLCLITPEESVGGPALLRFLNLYGITHATLTPSVLRTLPGTDAPSLQVLASAGEACTADLVDLWGDQVRFFNLYGPTEATIWSTFAECSPRSGPPPIGHAIPNTMVYILNSDLSPVTDGDVGELYIGGTGIARGYLNRPELTSHHFLSNPFEVHGGRLYRTGDLGRSRPDGAIEYVGRVDSQIKMRGIRIEVQEIESILRTHPGVRQAVVVPNPNAAGRLAAYVLPADDAPPSTKALRRFLEQRLPHYLVPSSFTAMATLPLLSSGKVDRHALPLPHDEDYRPERDEVQKMPQSSVEKAVAKVWRRVLGNNVGQIGVLQNFFELGGTSLLLADMAARLESAFKVAIPMKPILNDPTITTVAGCIEEATRTRSAPFVMLARIPRTQSFPLSAGQERLWRRHFSAPESPRSNIPFAVRLDGPVNVDALQSALQSVLNRHDSLRTCLHSTSGGPRQSITDQCALPHELQSLNLGPTEHDLIQPILEEMATRPFDLGRAPLWRSRILVLGPDSYVLAFVFHHIIIDGWSMEVFLRELSAYYGACLRSEPDPFRDLAFQYVDFAAWQRECLTAELRAEQLAFWRQQLTDAPPPLKVPADFARPSKAHYRGGLCTSSVPALIASQLKAFSRSQSVTLFTTMLASFMALLAQITGERDLLVATPIASKRPLGTESIIGYAVNFLPIRVRLTSTSTFASLLATVREATLAAYAHADVPFEEVPFNGEAGSEDRLSVMFVMDEDPTPSLRIDHVHVKPVPMFSRACNRDLTLTVTPRLDLSLVYNEDILAAYTAARLLSCFSSILHCATTSDQAAGHSSSPQLGDFSRE